MANELSAVVDVRLTRPGESVYGLFKECGTIKSIHSWKKPNESEVVHYFVVFADPASVPRAVSAPTVVAAGATVTPVEAQAELAAAYMRMHPDPDTTMRSPSKPPTSNTGAPAGMPPPPVPPVRAPEPVVDPPTSLDLQHMGASIRLDLAGVDTDNPRPLIALLAKTGAERASWMLAGAYLRRTGYPGSAYAVVSAMVEAMTKEGMPEQDLKPAFLFLSGCHTDLARRVKPNGATTPASEAGPSSSALFTTSASEHAAEAKRLLQKVYGTQRPEPPSQPTPSIMVRPQENGKSNNKRRPQATTSEMQILQREVQSLRDRNEHLTRQLRKAERAADDTHGELANERAARRRAESAAEIARRDVLSARRDQRTAEEARDDLNRRLGEQAARMPMMGMPPGMSDPPMLLGMSR